VSDIPQLEPQAWRPKSLKEWDEEWRYRSAVIQYEGGFTRAEADAMALKIVGGISREEIRKNK
jgi:hypothetical protein